MLNVNLPSHDDEATVRSIDEVRLEDKAISHSVTFHRNSYSGQSCPELLNEHNSELLAVMLLKFS